MDYSLSSRGAVQVLSLHGPVDRHSAGMLYDAVLKCVGWNGAKLAVDLSGVTRLTRAGARGLIVAAKLASRTGGEMRICGAKPMIFVFLRGLGFEPFIKLDRTLDEGMAVLEREPIKPSHQTVSSAEVSLPLYFKPANDIAGQSNQLPVGSGA